MLMLYSQKSAPYTLVMKDKEILQYLRENNYDVCPECENRKGNEITLPSTAGEDGCITCANPECGISFWPGLPDE